MNGWKPTKYGLKAKETNWLNGTVTFHDTFCGCDEPMLHFIKALTKRGGIYTSKPEELKKLIEECLTTGTAGDTAKAIIPGDNFGGPEDVLDGVDIEKLFESDGPSTEGDDG